jgi:nitrile hydratase accessory protein
LNPSDTPAGPDRLRNPALTGGAELTGGVSQAEACATILPHLTGSKNVETPMPALPRDDGGPVFAEPWQAQAFALAVRLSERGYFTWKEWTVALAEEIKCASERGEVEDGSRYYEHWLAALERLVTAKALSDPVELAARKEACHTPHESPSS